MSRLALTASAVAVVSVLVGASAAAAPPGKEAYQTRIALPVGFSPEGVAVDHNTFFAGNTATGAIWAGDLRTGVGDYLVPDVAGRSAFGIFPDTKGRLWVAGGGTGNAYVYDGKTGELLATYVLEPGPVKRINDVYVAKDAAYFTCGSVVCTGANAIYKVALDKHDELPDQTADPGSVTKIPVGIPPTGGARDGLNGIRGWDHDRMLVVGQTGTGKLFAVDPDTGNATEIPLVNGDGQPELVPSNDGLIIGHKIAYSVSNQAPAGYIAAIRFEKDLSSGVVLAHLNSAQYPLRNPSTIDFVDHKKLMYVLARDANNPTQPVALQRIDIPRNKELEDDDD
jgi:outer membrane protein assembly factor BamB